jgi:deoxyribodipyrimidine photo-lyase
MTRVIWWLRRDLRLTDNLTLHQALRDAASVIPAFVLDARLLERAKLAPARRQFLFDSLVDLDAQLHARGSRLILRRGDPAKVLADLARESAADAVYFHRDLTPYARMRDERVTRLLHAAGIRVETFNDLYLAAPEQVVKDDGTPYAVYTPYRKRFEQVVALPPRYATHGELNTPPDIESLDLRAWTGAHNPQFARGGETEGLKLARAFMRRADGLVRYDILRDDLARDATSHLSAHLHFGAVSVRELARRAHTMAAASPTPLKPRNAVSAVDAKGAGAWLGELVWRDFYAQVLWHFPHAARQSFRREYADLPWENDAEEFAAWREGSTGYPVVDAAMRQLRATGWMHNRARMIVASFLTKDLLIDWRWGERHFMQNLIDGDVSSNNGGCQWSAGTGTDAQPFFRIFNPTEQGKRHDATGDYVRRWVPELARVPNAFIHAPGQMPREAAHAAGIEIGMDYPRPIVDHAHARARALVRYRRAS